MSISEHKWMGRCACLAVLAATLAGGCDDKPKALNLSTAEQSALSQVTSVAILPLADAPGSQGRGSGAVVAGAMTPYVQAPGLRVVERAQLARLVEEQDLKALFSDATTTAQLGKQIGVDVVMVGEVSQYQARSSSRNVALPYVGGSLGGTSNNHYVGLNIRAVRVSDATVIYARSGNGKDSGGFTAAADEAARKALDAWQQYYQQRTSP